MEWKIFDTEEELPSGSEAQELGRILMLEPDDDAGCDKTICVRMEGTITRSTFRALGCCTQFYSWSQCRILLVDVSNVDPKVLKMHAETLYHSMTPIRTEEITLALIGSDQVKTIMESTQLAKLFKANAFSSDKQALEMIRQKTIDNTQEKKKSGWRLFDRFRRQ